MDKDGATYLVACQPDNPDEVFVSSAPRQPSQIDDQGPGELPWRRGQVQSHSATRHRGPGRDGTGRGELETDRAVVALARCGSLRPIAAQVRSNATSRVSPAPRPARRPWTRGPHPPSLGPLKCSSVRSRSPRTSVNASTADSQGPRWHPCRPGCPPPTPPDPTGLGQGHHRDHPAQTDHRAGTGRDLSAPDHPAPDPSDPAEQDSDGQPEIGQLLHDI